MKNVLVSIIVPVYNVEDYLERCISSIINQSYTNLEIILVNDGSTDKSGEICHVFANHDARIILIEQSNLGLSGARNSGLDISTGDYVLFVDSDDWIDANLVDICVKLVSEYKADIVEFGYYPFDRFENIKLDYPKKNLIDNLNSKAKLYNNAQAIKNILSYKFSIMSWNKFYHKKLFYELRFPEGKIHEDEFITPLLVSKCETYLKIDFELYYYLIRSNSIMNIKVSEKNLDIFEAYEYRRKYFESNYGKKYNSLIAYGNFNAANTLLTKLRSDDGNQCEIIDKVKKQKFVSLVKVFSNLNIALILKALITLIFPNIIYKNKLIRPRE